MSILSLKYNLGGSLEETMNIKLICISTPAGIILKSSTVECENRYFCFKDQSAPPPPYKHSIFVVKVFLHVSGSMEDREKHYLTNSNMGPNSCSLTLLHIIVADI